MIQRLKNIETNFTVSKAAFIVGFFALLSRLVGMLREALFASLLGPGDRLDVYYASFRIPDFVFNLLILGTLSVSFIPVFTELIIKDKKRAFGIANTMLNISVLSMTSICILLMVFAVPLTELVVPGFSGEKFSETVQLTRIFLLSPILFTVSSVFSSMLHSHRKFLIVSLAPIFYNFGIIFGLLILYPRYGLVGWGAGILLGALMHVLIQVPSAVRLGYFWQPVMFLRDAAFRKIARLFFPRIFGLDISNVSLLIATVIGSTLAAGTISIFNLANNLQAVPLGIFALSIAVAAFPALSQSYATENFAEFLETLRKSISQIIFFIVPISILMLLFRAHIVRLIYGHGVYSWEDTTLTFATLGMFSISLFAQSLSPLFSRSFYAQHNTKTPVMINALSMVLNGVLAYMFARQGGVFGGAVGLAAAFSIASVFNTFTLFFVLRIKLNKWSNQLGAAALGEFDSKIFESILKTCVASIVMGVAAYFALRLFEPVVNNTTTVGLLLQSSFSGLLGVGIFLCTAHILKLKEADLLLGFLSRIFRLFGYKK